MSRDVLLLPGMSRMDHARPAIEYLEKNSGEHKTLVILIPLRKHVEDNMDIFIDFLSHQHNGVEIIRDPTILDVPDGYDEGWKKYLENLRNRHKKLGVTRGSKIIVAVTDEMPLSIAMATAVSGLILPYIELIQFPTGYDIGIEHELFQPKAPLAQQIRKLSTWGEESIRKPMIEIAKAPKLVETLTSIRILFDENDQNPVKSGEIKRHINESKKQHITSANNTARLKRLKEVGVIVSHEKARYSLNNNGLLLSGLFMEDMG